MGTAVRVFDDETIGGLLDEGILDPGELGLKWMEVRYFGSCMPSKTSPCEHTKDTRNQWRSVYRKVEGYHRPDYTHEDDPAACLNMWQSLDHAPEGIGGEYLDGGTFSYLSDDPVLWAKVQQHIRDLMCLTCGAQTFPDHTDTAHEPNWTLA